MSTVTFDQFNTSLLNKSSDLFYFSPPLPPETPQPFEQYCMALQKLSISDKCCSSRFSCFQHW